MKIEIQVSRSEATRHEFAQVTLSCSEVGVTSILDISLSSLYRRCRIPSPAVLDLLFLSSIIYNVDKLVARSKAEDNWTRLLELEIPVSNPECWDSVTNPLEESISFLTGDIWKLRFCKLEYPLHRPRRLKYRRRRKNIRVRSDAVCLFSGGLDSLIGAIDWLEKDKQKNLLLVGHNDYPGPKSDQYDLWRCLKSFYNTRTDLLQIRVSQNPAGREISLRSRSFVFVALGIYAAASIGKEVPLLIPENGTIALNVPLTPSRRGSCSTRTTHPFFLKKLRETLEGVGINNTLFNPLESKTKGECVRECLNQELLKSVALRSVSCAKSGHTREWCNRSASGCGYCMPCIFRRASLHTIGLDTEVYGRDICTGQVHPHSDGVLPNDFRAVLSFLRNKPSRKYISYLLVMNGKISIDKLPEYSVLVNRAMDEIRSLIRDKACDDIKRFAGIDIC